MSQFNPSKVWAETCRSVCRSGSASNLLPTQLAALHAEYSRHGRLGDDGTSELNFHEFVALATALQLPLSKQSEEEQRSVFAEVATSGGGSETTVSFEELCAWIEKGASADAVALRLLAREEESAFSAGLVRAVTGLIRPLSGVALIQALIAMKFKLLWLAKSATVVAKKCMMFAKAKAFVSAEAAVSNPWRLFRRQVVSPLDAFRVHPSGILGALREEHKKRGVRGIGLKTTGPYLANAVVAMSMFHTYTYARLSLHMLAVEHPMIADSPLRCEAAAASAAGVVQATMHTPLYNMRLGREENIAAVQRLEHKGLSQSFRELYGRGGLPGCFRNYPFVLVQETCSLVTFFASYEWFKTNATILVHHHVDASGEKDIFAWASAASLSGVVMVAVGTPFENVLTWHVSRRGPSTPNSVFAHFVKFGISKPHAARLVLWSGMRKKLIGAPLMGLPLLAYEFMIHRGWAPALR